MAVKRAGHSLIHAMTPPIVVVSLAVLVLAITYAATAQESPPVFVGAGDISTCTNDYDEATAQLLDEIEGTVFTLGDNVYEDGTPAEFEACYDPTWGRHLNRTRPVPGNHDYHFDGAEGYFDYFGDAAGHPDRGYYSYNLGEWHIVALNTNCEEIGGCGVDSPQLEWLIDDLAKNPARCTLAYSHHPRFSSFAHADDTDGPDMSAIWQVLHIAGAEMLLSGHEHAYERFAPQDPEGNLDAESGVRQFIVGTGGASLRNVEDVQPHSEARNTEAFGVLKLTLAPDSYAWEFVPIDGQEYAARGTGECH